MSDQQSGEAVTARLEAQANYMDAAVTPVPAQIQTDSPVWSTAISLLREAAAEITSLRQQLQEARAETHAQCSLAPDMVCGLVPAWDALRAKLTAAEARADAAERERDTALSAPMAAGLLLTLKAECEAQHARADAAERERDGWRSWAQFVFLGGGPVTHGDDLLREGVAAAYDAETARADAAEQALAAQSKDCPFCHQSSMPAVVADDDYARILICAKCARETADFFGARRERDALKAQLAAAHEGQARLLREMLANCDHDEAARCANCERAEDALDALELARNAQ